MKKTTNRKKEGTELIWFVSIVMLDISVLAFVALPFFSKTNKPVIVNLIIYIVTFFYGLGKIFFEAIKDKETKEKIKCWFILLVLWFAPIILYIAIKYVLTAIAM